MLLWLQLGSLPSDPPTRALHLLQKACSPRRQKFPLTHYTVKSSITRFFNSPRVLNFNHYKHCSKCYEKKCTLGFVSFSIQGRQKRITTFTSVIPPTPLSYPWTLQTLWECWYMRPIPPSLWPTIYDPSILRITRWMAFQTNADWL